MLFIHHPPSYDKERNYIYDVIFREFLGLEYRGVVEDRSDICVRMADDNQETLTISDKFFAVSRSEWMQSSSLPLQPLPKWDIEEKEIQSLNVNGSLPIIYGNTPEEGTYLSCSDQGITIAVDIFGSAFFMLTQYEEIVKSDRDNHDRFPAQSSLAYREGFLERPIINEYVEILWWALKKLWPGLQRKQRHSRIIPTHDVDSPFGSLFLSPYAMGRTLAGDLLKRRNLTAFMKRITNLYKVKTGNVLADDHYTFDLIMDISEKHNLTSSFYMMEAQGQSQLDGNYPLDHPYIIKLMQSIHNRGHEIGLHPSYVSYQDGQEVKREAERLLSLCHKHGIQQSHIGGRQHYLRWRCPDTWQHYEDAGLVYDTTLSFADHIGFRCGVCYEYPVFNVLTGEVLKLKERPLIVMECSALDSRYMNLSHEEALERIINLKNICLNYNGDFVLLWHNSRFIDIKEIELYKAILL